MSNPFLNTSAATMPTVPTYQNQDLDPSLKNYYTYTRVEKTQPAAATTTYTTATPASYTRVTPVNNTYVTASSPTVTQYTTVTTKPRKEGLMAKVERGLGSIVSFTEGAVKKTGQQIEALANTTTTRDSHVRWQLFGIEDTLLGEYPCKVVNNNRVVRGYLFISYNYLCFSSYVDSYNRVERVVIPLRTIARITQAEKVKGNSYLPVILPITRPEMRPNVIQVTTTDNMLHQFYGIRYNYQTAFNLLNHAWESARVRPVYGEQYTQYQMTQQTVPQQTTPTMSTPTAPSSTYTSYQVPQQQKPSYSTYPQGAASPVQTSSQPSSFSQTSYSQLWGNKQTPTTAGQVQSQNINASPSFAATR